MEGTHPLCKGIKPATIALGKSYRSLDEEHIGFLDLIRMEQPDRPRLETYFADWHWPLCGPLQNKP